MGFQKGASFMDLNPSLLHNYPAALDRAVRMLAERSRSKKEIADRLASAGFDEEVIGLVIFKLEKENLLDDRDFAEQWVLSRGKKYGSVRISRELHAKGIDRDVASSALETLSVEEQLEHASAFAAKKIRSQHSASDKMKLKQRVVAALIRRGYSWDIAVRAYESALAPDNEQSFE